MIDREIALEAVGVLCNAKVTAVNRSDESRESVGDGSGVAELLLRSFGFGNVPTNETTAQTEPKKQIKLEIQIDEEEFFDPGYDYDFTNVKDTETYYRGDEEYKRPCGYKRFALKVLGEYEDDTWLGHVGRTTESVKGEWPVSYHGSAEDSVDHIIKEYLKAADGAVWGIYSTPDFLEADINVPTIHSKKDGKYYTAFLQNRINPKYIEKFYNDTYWMIKIPEGTSEEEQKELAGPGQWCGRGVYSTPHISVAEKYTKTFTSKKDGKDYKVILQNRINPKYREICEKQPEYWLIRIPEGTPEEDEKELVKRAIRPYGLLIKEVK